MPFDIGWAEMAVILLIALIVIGPKDLPRVARTLGKWAAKGRALTREFQASLAEMAREAELDKVKSEIEKAGKVDIGKSIEKAVDPDGKMKRAFEMKDDKPPAQAKAPAKKANGKAPAVTDETGAAPAAEADKPAPAATER